MASAGTENKVRITWNRSHCAHLGPFTRRILNRPVRDLFVDAEICGQRNQYYERIADCTCCGKLSGNGMDTIHHSKGYASCQSTDDHDRHVGIKSAIRMLMEFNIGRNRKPGHRPPKPYPVYDQSAGCEY